MAILFWFDQALFMA